MNAKDKILDKIKKCLALSRSANEHEAAAALRQARKMMEAHDINEMDVDAAQVSEAHVKAGAYLKPAQWESALARTVGDAMNCMVIFGSPGLWKFIGVGAKPASAEYAFVVLFRQLKKTRREYIQTRLKRCRNTAKVRRADQFCEGWVFAVRDGALGQFAGENPDQALIEAYNERRHPELYTLNANQRSGRDYGDKFAGFLRGKKARLHHGVGGADQQALLEVGNG
jgi:hypothetical protein